MKLNKIDLFKYAICPECGNENIGNGEGGIVIDETYTRYCKCGFKVTIFVNGIEKEERTTISQLDTKVNSEETLRDFIKNSYKEFYETEILDKELDLMDEISLTDLADHLDYLWTK